MSNKESLIEQAKAKDQKVQLQQLQRQVKRLEGENNNLTARLVFDSESPIVRSQMIVMLTKGGRFIELSTLAAKMGASDGQVVDMLSSLKLSGYNVKQRGTKVAIVGEFMPTPRETLKIPMKGRRTYTFGVVSDPHLCSTAQRLDVLETAYDEFARRKIKDVYLVGNYIDGESRFNQYELLVHGVTDQVMYFVDHYPQRAGITTKFIAGECHEGWYTKKIGLDIGKYTEMFAADVGRKDLKYLGHLERDVELKTAKGSSIMRLFHPGGGTSYALSYKPQKIVEAYSGGEKPHILLLGHFHKSGYFCPRGVHVLLCGCIQDQTKFMRKLGLAAHLAFWIVTVELAPDGSVYRWLPEEFAFYDREFYAGNQWTTLMG